MLRSKAWAALFCLAVTACGLNQGAQAAHRVILSRVDTDVVFGASSTAPHAVSQPGQVAVNVPQPVPSLTLPYITFPQTQFGGLCATAPATEFPSQQAVNDVRTMPVAGQYKWAGGGSWVLTVLTTRANLPLPLTFESEVRNVQAKSDPLAGLPGSQPQLVFTYELVQPDFTSTHGFWDYTFQVKTNAQEGDPEGGLALKAVDHYDRDFKNAVSYFSGEPALLLMPLPAAPGPVGVNTPAGSQGSPTSLDTSGKGDNMTFSGGTVGSRERVDACGTPIQAWPVDGTLTNGAGATARIHLDVATQWGAMVVAFNIDGSLLGEAYTKATTKVGQAPPPEPLPKAFQ